MRIDNNFCYFLKYLCSPEKGCFSCVVLKRAVFYKRCYCCLMPVIFAWNSGCWSFSAKYLSDLCLDLSGKTFLGRSPVACPPISSAIGNTVTMCTNQYRWKWTCLVWELVTMSNRQYSNIDSIPFSLRTPGSLYQTR